MRRFLRRCLNVVRPSRSEPDLAREVASHLALLEDEFVRRGMPAEDARFAARRAFGGVAFAQDLHRDARSFVWLDETRRDVGYAVRTLRQSPGFAVVVLLTLALGIGANTAGFSLVNSLLLRALPVVEPERLATISAGTEVDQRWTYAIWNQLKQHSACVDAMFAWSAQPFNLAHGGETEPVDGLWASGDYFTALGVRALKGRTFTSADDVRGGGPDGAVAVISYGLWQRRFGGAPDAIGTQLVVERVPFTIIGVTPPEFFGAEIGRAFDVALPLGAEPLIHGQYSLLDAPGFWLTVMLRLKPGQPLEAAAANLREAQPLIREAAKPPYIPPGFRFMEDPFVLVPAATGTSLLRQHYLRPLLAMQAGVALVLLIACVNVANLMLARGTARRHEFSVRLALGASHWRLARQLLAESLLLAGIGATAAVGIAAWCSRALVAQLSEPGDRVFLDLSLDWRVLTFTATVTVAAAVLFGAASAWRASRVAPIGALRTQAIGSQSGRAGPAGLIVGQAALTLMLLVVAGLFVRTFDRLAKVPMGFDEARLLVVRVDATRAPVAPANRIRFYERLVAAVSSVPGVASAAVSMITPVSGAGMIEMVEVPGVAPVGDPERAPRINYVMPGWFATYGMAIRAGRDVDAGDGMGAPRVFLVNDAFARRFLPGRGALGATVANQVRGRGQTPVLKTVIGVVDDAVYRSARDGVQPTVYAPLAQLRTTPAMISISVRVSTGPPAATARSVAMALTAVDPELTFSIRPLADQVRASLTQERLMALVSGVFGGLALLLAAVGLYGITAYMVACRRSEIGIRTALGAGRADVVGLVLRQTIGQAAVGAVLGVASAAAVTRCVQSQLFGVTPLDITTFAAVALLFGVVATLAAFVPARRAASVDPLIALRSE